MLKKSTNILLLFLFIYKELLTSSTLGRGTLTARHLLLMGAITFEVELQHRISRQVNMYFSIVRRKACWASLVRRSTSVSSTTVKTWEMLSLPIRLYYCCVSVRIIDIKRSNPDTALSYLTFRLIVTQWKKIAEPLNSLWALDWICWDWATVLISSWMTTRSLFPASLRNTDQAWGSASKCSQQSRVNLFITLDSPLDGSCWQLCWFQASF